MRTRKPVKGIFFPKDGISKTQENSKKGETIEKRRKDEEKTS